MKTLATSKYLLSDFELNKLPLDMSASVVSSKLAKYDKGINIANLLNNTIEFKAGEDFENNVVVNVTCFEKRRKEIGDELKLSSIMSIHSSDIYSILKKIYGEEDIKEKDIKVEIDKIKLLSEDTNNLLLLFTTIYYENKAYTYLFFIGLNDVGVDVSLFNLIHEYDDIQNIQKVTSVSYSEQLSTISIILGNNYHIVLKRDKKLSEEIHYSDEKVLEGPYIISLKNFSRFTNSEDKRTLYSSVNDAGNRIIVTDRDEEVKVRNNTNITNIGTFNSLVYDHKKSKWILEDRFFERNLNIRNLGEHVDLDKFGFKAITSSVYSVIDEQQNPVSKDVIYLLSRNHDKWKKLARGIINGDVTNLKLIDDNDNLLVETTITENKDDGETHTFKKLNHLFREDDRFATTALVDDSGIFQQVESLDPMEYISFINLDSNIYDCLVLVKDMLLEEDVFKLFTLKTQVVNVNPVDLK